MLGFDLETFPNQSDMARSGRYLGNGPVTLIMTETVSTASKSVNTLSQADMARSGRYLGNGPVTLVMTNTIAPSVKSVSSQAAIDTYNAIAVVLFDIRFSIMSGGQVLSYY